MTVQKVLAEGKAGSAGDVLNRTFDRYKPLARGVVVEGKCECGEWVADGPGAAPGGSGAGVVWDAEDGDGEVCGLIVRVRRLRMRFDIAMGYEGLLVWCRASLLACEAAPRFLVHGVNGSFRKWGLDPQEPAIVGRGEGAADG